LRAQSWDVPGAHAAGESAACARASASSWHGPAAPAASRAWVASAWRGPWPCQDGQVAATWPWPCRAYACRARAWDRGPCALAEPRTRGGRSPGWGRAARRRMRQRHCPARPLPSTARRRFWRCEGQKARMSSAGLIGQRARRRPGRQCGQMRTAQQLPRSARRVLPGRRGRQASPPGRASDPGRRAGGSACSGSCLAAAHPARDPADWGGGTQVSHRRRRSARS
jgi:hypothetical protein